MIVGIERERLEAIELLHVGSQKCTCCGKKFKETDEKLNELISDYPNYDVRSIFKINIDTVQRLKDTGYDSVDSLVDIPRIWATVIMEKKEH